RKLPRAIPIVRATRKSRRSTKNLLPRSNFSPSTTFSVVGPGHRRNTSAKAVFSTRSTRTELQDLIRHTICRRNRGICEHRGCKAQHVAGVWSHHGTDPHLALHYHLAAAGRAVSQDVRTQR